MIEPGLQRNRFDRMEWAGAFGDLGTFIPFVVAYIIDRNDVRVAQARHRLRFALKPRPLGRPGMGAGDEHLEGDQPFEAAVPGLVDDAHAPATEQRLHVIAHDLRQVGARMRRR